MNREGQPCRQDWGSLVLCALLSLLLHLALLWALELLPPGHGRGKRRQAVQPVRHVQVVRTAKPTPAEKPEEPEAPFAKTSADTPERRPEQVDFIGSHDTTASGADDAPRRQADAPVPTQTGRESEDELVTFDQERQDGDLAHEKKAGEAPPAPATPASEQQEPPSQRAQPLAQGQPEGSPEQHDSAGEGQQAPQHPADATAARNPAPPSPGEGLKLAEAAAEQALTLSAELPPPAPLGQPEGQQGNSATPAAAQPTLRRAPVYDPSLADNAQHPGLRTHERRTRSTGRFIFGRRPALNVAATARGRYEAEIYRRIARMWYAACDEHRGDIIPGSITVSLRLTKTGRIDSMDLVRRRGASISQQSFSFAAIRHAVLPAMPAEVQQGIIGRLYEMILTFNFD